MERIYSAGKNKLLTSVWLAKLMEVRAATVAWIKQTVAWQAVLEAKRAIAEWWRGLRGGAA